MREVLRTFEAESIDSIVSDPPYGLAFMSKNWDKGVPGEEFWKEALRVAKPGAHLLAFGGTRTYHRLMCAIEDAGWEIRDCIMWVYGSGFPKSLNVSKAIDKAAGAEREVVGQDGRSANESWLGTAKRGETGFGIGEWDITAPATEAAKQWAGWGTALKPAWEPIIVARKPLEGTVAQNTLKYGTGGMNIDGCRVGASAGDEPLKWEHGRGMGFHGAVDRGPCAAGTSPGRFPANLIHDNSDEVLALFPETAPAKKNKVSDERSVPFMQAGGEKSGGFSGRRDPSNSHDDNGGSAARFFYCAKANKKDRDEGNKHPTVKPTALMRYCVKMVTAPGGVVLDPFCGSGSTGKAAMLEGMNFIGIDLDPEYLRIAEARIEHALKNRESKC